MKILLRASLSRQIIFLFYCVATTYTEGASSLEESEVTGSVTHSSNKCQSRRFPKSFTCEKSASTIHPEMAVSQGKSILIYGGKGALGSALVEFFKAKEFWVGNIDFTSNDNADLNIILGQGLSFEQQAEVVTKGIPEDLKVDSIINVAGGWAGGNLTSPDFLKNAQLMLEQSLWSSYIAASLAPKFLKENGTLVLTGAQPALKPTAGMIGYGVAKAAVHQLTKSVGADNGGLPKGGKAYAILPVTLDTPMNRKWMKHNDTWTPLEDVAKILNNWISQQDTPPSGSLVQVITKNGKTETIVE